MEKQGAVFRVKQTVIHRNWLISKCGKDLLIVDLSNNQVSYEGGQQQQ